MVDVGVGIVVREMFVCVLGFIDVFFFIKWVDLVVIVSKFLLLILLNFCFLDWGIMGVGVNLKLIDVFWWLRILLMLYLIGECFVVIGGLMEFLDDDGE